MKAMIPPDQASRVSAQCYAVVHVPGRNRSRFSAAVVKVVADKQAALADANPDKKQYAALVHGPSKSSEGQLLYYLLDWLE